MLAAGGQQDRQANYLNTAALEVLAGIERVAGNSYVIVGLKPGSHLIGLTRPWYRIRAKAGLEDVRLHDLRYSFASVAAASGLSLPMIGKLLGHSQPITTARYAHLAADPMLRASELVGETIGAAMQGRPKAEVVQVCEMGDAPHPHPLFAQCLLTPTPKPPSLRPGPHKPLILKGDS